MSSSFEVQEFVHENGRSPFAEWFNGLDAVTAARVDKYVRRLASGNFGNSKHLSDGVFEIKMDFGPGPGFIMPDWGEL